MNNILDFGEEKGNEEYVCKRKKRINRKDMERVYTL
jgi:hypothetical protein